MPSNRKSAPLPEIAPCPCPKRCKVVIMQTMPGTWRVVSDCGFAGPQRFTKRTAREAWNRRAPDTDREALIRERAIGAAEQRGIDAVATWLFRSYPKAWMDLASAVGRGEVIPKEGKPEPASVGGRRFYAQGYVAGTAQAQKRGWRKPCR